MRTFEKRDQIFMERISSSALWEMKNDEEVLVNVIRINSRLSKLERSPNIEINEEAIRILCEKLNEVSVKQIRCKRPVMNVKMTVENIKKCFSDIATMPAYSFAKVSK